MMWLVIIYVIQNKNTLCTLSTSTINNYASYPEIVVTFWSQKLTFDHRLHSNIGGRCIDDFYVVNFDHGKLRVYTCTCEDRFWLVFMHAMVTSLTALFHDRVMFDERLERLTNLALFVFLPQVIKLYNIHHIYFYNTIFFLNYTIFIIFLFFEW